MVASRGYCLCRSITYEFDGEPKWVAHCHCESCRRATSSVVATYVGVNLEQFRYSQAGAATYQSSPGVWRHFCPRCGSPIAYTADRFPGEIHLHLGSFRDPNQFVPRGHVYAGEQLAWFEIADELPRYETLGGKGVAPMRRGPRASGES